MLNVIKYGTGVLAMLFASSSFAGTAQGSITIKDYGTHQALFADMSVGTNPAPGDEYSDFRVHTSHSDSITIKARDGKAGTSFACFLPYTATNFAMAANVGPNANIVVSKKGNECFNLTMTRDSLKQKP